MQTFVLDWVGFCSLYNTPDNNKLALYSKFLVPIMTSLTLGSVKSWSESSKSFKEEISFKGEGVLGIGGGVGER